MNSISIHKSLFVHLFLQSLSAQIDVSKELENNFYDIELSKHANYFANKNDNTEIDRNISTDKLQIENFKNIDSL